MLVCSISVRPKRGAIAVGIVETATALDDPGTGSVVFATLVDDPASVLDRVDAYLGEIMLEVANATDSFDAGMGYALGVDEGTVAQDSNSATVTPAPAGTTWSPSDKSSNIALSNGNLTATISGSALSGCRGTVGLSSGKYYWEFMITTIATNSYGGGLATAAVALGSSINTAGVTGVNGLGTMCVNGTVQSGGLGTRVNGDILGVAVDLTAKLIWYRVAPSGNWNGSGTANPATGTGGYNIAALSLPLYPYMGWVGNAAGQVITANFGASTFSGLVPSGFTSGWQ